MASRFEVIVKIGFRTAEGRNTAIELAVMSEGKDAEGAFDNALATAGQLYGTTVVTIDVWTPVKAPARPIAAGDAL